MIRSLRTGISGLKSNQVRMDVVGNNVANVNTAAFKRSRVAFNELLGQRMLGLGRTAGGSGINPASIGTGVAVGSVDRDWTQGSFEYTNIGTDLALSGDGFFIARGIDGNVLTRAGNFTFNAQGELVTAGGLSVQGWAYDRDGSLRTGQLQNIRLDLNVNAAPRATGSVGIGGNLSADLAGGESVTMSTAIYDSQGRAHTIVLSLDKTAMNTWAVTSAEIAGDPPTALDTTGMGFEFGTDGKLLATAPTSFTVAGGAGVVFPGTDEPISFELDIQGLTQYGGSTTAVVSSQDGLAAGKVVGYGIDPSGRLTISFSNGEQRPVARLAIGMVNNPNGLEQLGENFYGVTTASGDLTIGQAGREVSTAVVAGALEMSNVDLATEFTEMIVTQRGYQASARVITTSDELLQEVVQLKR